jgi:glycerol-3-phosphate dehydrogenase
MLSLSLTGLDMLVTSRQDLLTQNQTQEKELITLRKLERNSKELQQCLHTAQLQTRELAAMITAVRVEYAVVNDEVQEAFDVIWQRTYRNLLLQLSMSGSNLCDAVTQTSITFCSEADWLECHMHKDNLERMHTRYSGMLSFNASATFLVFSCFQVESIQLLSLDTSSVE